MWDNHEFSWKGWQSQQDFGRVRPAQTKKVAACQAWFEYQPARVVKANADVDRYEAPHVKDAAITQFDESGLGQEPGNLAAINSLKLYRKLRYGRDVDLILTDNRSFRSQEAVARPEAAVFNPKDFPFVSSQNVVEMLDGGRSYNNGKPPETIQFGGKDLPNPRKDAPAGTILGDVQKKWFLEQLRGSKATWKLWGNSVCMLDWRTDFQNLPKEIGVVWPDAGYAAFADDDWAGYRTERAEILRVLSREEIAGMVSLAGDRHSFFAGVVSPTLPPYDFKPVAAEFVTGSVSAPTLFEAAEFSLPKDHRLRAIYLYQAAAGGPVQPAMNFAAMHGVRSALELQKTGDMQKALAVRNADVAPHLSFLDSGGHGYVLIHVSEDKVDAEFVCIPRPLERNEGPDGGPVAYRVLHRVKRWNAGETPKMERVSFEGKLPLVV